jgi:putative transposase
MPLSCPLRIAYEGACYRVMHRGAKRRTIFPGDADWQVFLSVLGDIAAIFGVEVHAYCLMDTHYHLLLRTPRGNLSRAMRYLNGVYTQRYSRLHRTDGPLFRAF